MSRQSAWQRLVHSYHQNSQQVQFGSYAAELSFYILWAITPILLALANIIAILPIDQDQILSMLEKGIPVQVQSILMPLLKDYLKTTSSSIFSIGLIISLWPASNVFNTLQRVFNKIYKAKPRKNMIVGRIFAYIFTIVMVAGVFVFTSMVMFSEQILRLVQAYIPQQFDVVNVIFSQGWIVGMMLLLCGLLVMYYVVPNVGWSIHYAIPGTIFACVGFVAISQLFTIYLSFAKRSISNQTIGIFIILMIWLYFNAMVLCLGAYLNVLYHDYKEPNLHVEKIQKNGDILESHSSNFLAEANVLSGKISKKFTGNLGPNMTKPGYKSEGVKMRESE